MNTEAKENSNNNIDDFLDVETLKRLKQVSDFYSDMSSRTLLYNYICQQIIAREGNPINLESAKCNKHGVIKLICHCATPRFAENIAGDVICLNCGYSDQQTVL